MTAASLYVLLQRAYSEDCTSDDPNSMQLDSPTFEEWCIQRSEASAHFDYWLKTLLLLRYIRSLREGNFPLYVESLTQIVPWMFALDHTHYSRWLPVHICDMTTLAACKAPRYPSRIQVWKLCGAQNQKQVLCHGT